MFDWNVVVTVHQDAYTRSCQIFSQFGEVRRCGYYNVFLLKVPDQRKFLERLSALTTTVPELLEMVSRVMPAEITFDFEDRDSFESKARDMALRWVPMLLGKSFHVRMHRRGFHDQMSSREEERFLDEAILTALADEERPGHISFEDPDIIIDVDSVDGRAGLSCWTRDDLAKYPFLKLD